MINELSNFLDKNIRIVQYGSPILAATGVVLILVKTHAFSLFKSVHEIPSHLISRNIALRGVAKDVVSGSVLKVQHLPIFFRNLEARKKYFGQSLTLLDVSLVGIQPCSGCHEHIKRSLLDQNLKIVPLGVNDGTLQAVVYMKKGLFRQGICVNEDLIQRGVAVVAHSENLAGSKAYMHLSKRLLAAELRAEKRGEGKWQRPSRLERLGSWFRETSSKIFSHLKRQ